MELIYKKLDEIHPYENNPRKNDDAVDAVAASIKEFGFKVPIIVDNDGEIIAGHTRYKAAKKLKIKEVPTITADDLTDDQVRAFRLADNKTGELALWDFGKLDLEFAGIEEIDMSQFGFEDVTPLGIIEGGAELNYDEEPKKKTVICPSCGLEFIP